MADLFARLEYPIYLSPFAKRLGKKYGFVRDLGSGKSGATFLIQSIASEQLYCLKTISPAIHDADARNTVKETLKKEVEILSPLRHRCLPRIYEHDMRGTLPYYISTYHPGETWENFRLSDKRPTLSESIFVIASLIDVLEYLHEQGRTHCDLHGDNILISEEVFAEGLLIIDFGSGHRESDPADDTNDKGHGGFKNAKGQLQHRRRVNRAAAALNFKAYDFAALGKALGGMQSVFFHSAPNDQIIAYSDFSAMLQDGQVKTWAEVRERFNHVVDPTTFLTNLDHLFVRRDGTRVTIRIPATSPVPVGDDVLDVINHPTFQRLRHIKQLSFCEWYFPGGTHTRFEHSLGVFGIARRALERIVRDATIKTSYKQRNITGMLLASLVHDIGHYPFAHAIEHYVAGRFLEDRQSHDEIRVGTHHFNNTLRVLDSDKDLCHIIETKWGEGVFQEAKNVLCGNCGFLSRLLDGPVDCDKIDYLKRDSYHCGLPFGNGFNIDDVLSSFHPGADARELFIRASQVHSVEGFMVVQDQMLSAAYWHETVRAVFAMFHGFLAGTVGVDKTKILDLVERLKRSSSDYEALHNVFRPLLRTSGIDRAGTEAELLPLIRMHFGGGFSDIYKPVAKYSFDDAINPRLSSSGNVFGTIMNVPEFSPRSGIPINREQIRRLVQCFRRAYGEKGAKPGRFEVLVDVPWGKNSNRMLKVVDDNGMNERDITKVSHLSSTIFENPTAFSAPVRVFVSPRLFNSHLHEIDSISSSALEKYFDVKSRLEDAEAP